jgi:uncharacterized protein (PEP-CTERM system associated)
MAVNAWRIAFAIAMVPISLPPAGAQNRAWTVTPTIGLRETYNDNVALSATPDRGEFITDIIPGLIVTGRGRRFTADLRYTGDILFYARNREQDRIANTLTGLGTLEAVERFFFVDAQARIGQDYISPFAARPSDITTVTNNRTETRALSLSPYVRSQFAGGYTYELRNRNTWSSTDTSFLAKVHTREWTGNVASPIRLFGWQIDANDTGIAYDQPVPRPERKSRIARGRLFYQPDPAVRLSASAGREENNFVQEEEMQSYDTYGYGILWKPTPRTTAQFDWERRYFGAAPVASLEHRWRLSAINLSYSKSATTYQQQLFNVPAGNTADLLDQIFRARIPDPVERRQAVEQFMRATGTPASLSTSLAFYSEQILRQERLQGSYALIGNRNSVALTAFRGTTDALTQAPPGLPAEVFLNPNSRIDQHGFGLTGSHRVTAFTSLALSGNRIYAKEKASGIDSVNDFVTLNVAQTLSPKTTALSGLTYSHFDSNNTSPVHARTVFTSIYHRF